VGVETFVYTLYYAQLFAAEASDYRARDQH
jgi:hypothetical protein